MEAIISSELKVLQFEGFGKTKVFKDDEFSPKERAFIDAKKKSIISEIMRAKRCGATEVEIVLDLIEKLARVDFMRNLLDELCNDIITTGEINVSYK